MDDFIISQNSAQNCNISAKECENKKDFVCNHFKEVTAGPLGRSFDELSCKADGNATKNELISKTPGRVKQGAFFSGKILSFGCSVCKDNHTFSPNDLLKHFRAHHKKTLPTYPCDLCDFVTNEFSSLQRHRIEHRNTLVTCELCSDDVQYSLRLLTRHYNMCHSFNGQFKCEWCGFLTMDVGTFIQHIHHHNESESHWKCSSCRHISLNEEDHQKHALLGTFAFTCQICGSGAEKSEELKDHTATVHKRDAVSKKALKSLGDSSTPINTVPNVKMLVTNSADSQSPKSLEHSNVTAISPIQTNRKQLKSEILNEAHQDGTIANSDISSEPLAVLLQEEESTPTPQVGNQSNTNGVALLMVKNTISLPPHCTTKVMGFKMVDGKKHLVLKVIPTTQQNLNHSFVEGVGESGPNLVHSKSNSPVENGQCSTGHSSASHCLTISPRSASCLQLDQDDITAVKVKLEGEETLVCRTPSPVGIFKEQPNICLNKHASQYPITNESDDSVHSHPTKTVGTVESTSCNSLRCHFDLPSLRTSRITQTAGTSCGTLFSRPALTKAVMNCGVVENGCNYEPKGNCATKLTDHSALLNSEKSNNGSLRPQNGQMSASQPLALASWRENAVGFDNCAKTLPNTEVFAFHNYSKESFSPSNTTKTSDDMCEREAGEESDSELMQVSLSLAETLEHSTDGEDANEQCETTDKKSLTEENPESVFQDFNIIKIEDESIPVCKKQSDSKSTLTFPETIVEQRSNTVFKKHLNKSPALSSTNADSLKETRTTLRILQLPDGKQPVFLKATEQRFAMPAHVDATTGFKVISNSGNPQINVSYMKPGLEISRNSISNSRTIGALAANLATVEKGTTFLSTSKPCIGINSNHYILNSAGLTVPLLLSSKPNSAPTDKTATKQPTCYLVQRSVPVTQTSTTSGIKLASTQFPLNSRQVLAMPATSIGKANAPPNGRQTFLLRYISPTKSGIVLNNQETKSLTHQIQPTENSGNKVILKIVTPTGRLLTSSATTSSSQPLFLATRPSTQCFLIASNKTDIPAFSGLKKKTLQNSVKKDVRKPFILPSQMNIDLQLGDTEKPVLAPRPIRPPSQRKRRSKALFDELPSSCSKVRRLLCKLPTQKETLLWKPVAKEVERTLRLSPFSSEQLIKCPRCYQPVVVLNHPDAAIPEAANIMKIVTRYKGAVTKVVLSQTTIQALSGSGLQSMESFLTKGASSHSNHPSPRRVQSCIQERFLLKMKLRKKSKKKYEVVKTLSNWRHKHMFECWFCGRLFKSQEDWIGHGQRHLMEATRDWNNLG
ncbi:zinc finger protein 518A [Gouania willdenowi]|uniref:C2H2-type domain-containing protein n=1 Tax=Gouania willdenowi TaxID=441366 RepID=A0A8C5GT38_GOUWI|nr:zinc finger protein 518A [Gouania willdenowi]XP_028332732.1 zinc finger protein 518A [Gouania willdenowi]XP_028332733.1 zinc finger protein 518A [Gouania willdenowi]